jgi:hypothetical protein
MIIILVILGAAMKAPSGFTGGPRAETGNQDEKKDNQVPLYVSDVNDLISKHQAVTEELRIVALAEELLTALVGLTVSRMALIQFERGFSVVVNNYDKSLEKEELARIELHNAQVQRLNFMLVNINSRKLKVNEK